MRKLTLHFNSPQQAWDGFGFTYVEACQTRDYAKCPQDYGGFSILSEARREAVLDLIFGVDGLCPGMVKVFLDCWHQPVPARANSDVIDTTAYDHETSTQWLRHFVREGAARTRRREGALTVLTTLYAPPAWMTRQRIVRGRDLDAALSLELAQYLVAWAKFLREQEDVPVHAVSLHNEGEDWSRWPRDGEGPGDRGHDYNLFWPPEQVAELVPLLRSVLDANGLPDVVVTPGENTNWTRFDRWGYAHALASAPAALRALGLITSHGFHEPDMGRWMADFRSAGIDRLRESRPELHAWTTSAGWGRKPFALLWTIEQSLYSTKLNGFIPWAGIHRPQVWLRGDPNPETAIVVQEDGSFSVQKEYFVYKHACRAGQPGMRVVPALVNDSEIVAFAFSGAGTAHPDAFVLANIGSQPAPLQISMPGRAPVAWSPWRTTLDATWQALPPATLPGEYVLPAQSATTFFATRSSS